MPRNGQILSVSQAQKASAACGNAHLEPVEDELLLARLYIKAVDALASQLGIKVEFFVGIRHDAVEV